MKYELWHNPQSSSCLPSLSQANKLKLKYAVQKVSRRRGGGSQATCNCVLILSLFEMLFKLFLSILALAANWLVLCFIRFGVFQFYFSIFIFFLAFGFEVFNRSDA